MKNTNTKIKDLTLSDLPLAGAVVGIFVGLGMKSAPAALIAGLIFGALGFYLGKEKAFTLKLQA